MKELDTNYYSVFTSGCTDEAIDLAIQWGQKFVMEKIIMDYPKHVKEMHDRSYYRDLATKFHSALNVSPRSLTAMQDLISQTYFNKLNR